jgi:hypothetical protein
MRRTLPIAVLILAFAAPAVAQARPAVGIGDQHATSYSEKSMRSLKKLKLARYVVRWDWYKDWYTVSQMDLWVHEVQKYHLRPMITFSRNWDRAGRKKIPSVKSYKGSFKRLRARYPQVRDFSPWNEPNAPEQPFTHKPGRAAKLYNAMRSVCPKKCTIAAGDVYDNKDMVKWVKSYKRTAKHVKVWAMHNYKDATRKRGTTKQFLNATRKGQVWLTETGGLRNRGGLKGQARAVKRVFHLAAKSHRIKRIYFYQWRLVSSRSWDSAFVSANGKKRPAYYVLKRQLKRHH